MIINVASSRVGLGTVLILGLLTTGCGSSPTTWPVSGRILFEDGTPVQSALVELSPVPKGPAARGKTDSEGRFVLTTNGQSGAVPGKHRITIVQVQILDNHPGHHKKHIPAQVLDPRYNRVTTSGLERTVLEQDNEITITVKARKSGSKSQGLRKGS